jgi:hypothetical protein
VEGEWGALRLTTIGRKSGTERTAMLGYDEDGQILVTMAMNGWLEAVVRLAVGQVAADPRDDRAVGQAAMS